MVDGLFYAGYGDDGSGGATSIKTFAKDNFVDPSGVYQPLDGDLTALAALDATAGILSKTAANTYARRTITGTSGRLTVSDGSGTSGNPTLDLATVSVGSSTSGGSTKFTVDSYGRISNASQATLTDLATPTADFSIGGFKLTNLGTPASSGDAATKGYVDTAVQGLDPKASVRAATTANITLSGAQTIDGVSVVATDRVLVKNQSSASENGIYVAASGAWSRATDMDAWSEVPGAYVFVEEGTANADKAWLSTADAGGTLNTTSITWSAFGVGNTGFDTAGTGLTSSGTTVDVAAGTGITTAADTVALAGQALALHNVTTAADKVIYATGSGTFTTNDLTSVARTLIAQSSQANMRTTGLGLGSIATQAASAVAITGGTLDAVDITNSTVDGGTF